MTTLRQQNLVVPPPQGGVGGENVKSMMNGKSVVSNGGIGRTTRAALGNLHNNVPVTRSQANLKKDGVVKPTRTLTKQKATLSLPQHAAVVSKPATRLSSKKEEAHHVDDDEAMEVDENNVAVVAMEDVVTVSYSNVLLSAPVEDIDKEDKDNPQLVVDYVNEIYAYLRHLEKVQHVKENYLASSNGTILPKMRAVLMDWLVDVHQQFNLLQETLYLTVGIIDRFLQEAASAIPRKMLQLVGVTAMFIASKYEEMYAPEIGDFVYITDNAYTQSQIRKMEIKIISTLDFQLGRPLPLHFLRRNSKAGFVDAHIHTLAKYIMELTIVDYKFAHIPPSMLAAAALAYALRLLDGDSAKRGAGFWTPTLVYYSNYKFEEICDLVRELAKMVQKVSNAPAEAKLMSVRKKYSDKKMMKIGRIAQLKSQAAVDMANGIF